MVFIAGPRQVGKTTVSTSLIPDAFYLNWDNPDHRRLFVEGPKKVMDEAGLLPSRTIIFDEIHKYRHWQDFLKGFYDSYVVRSDLHVLVTGSARLDTFRRGADSLVGRYFLYRMHPLSVAEIASTAVSDSFIQQPADIPADDFAALVEFGGFPQPYIRREHTFHNRWRRQREQLLLRQDLRDLTNIHEVGQVELLYALLRERVGGPCNYASLASRIRASEDSVRRWVCALESLYLCYRIHPWSRSVTRSLVKEPKVYLWDWSGITDIGARHENMIASHLLKAVHWWQDRGLGEFGLYYMRTRDQREVDFMVVRDDIPWMLVEVKTSPDAPLNPCLDYFQKLTGAMHAFQVGIDAPFINADCFRHTTPIKVPARTFLSQLV